jgi:outer membrane protein
MRRIEKIYSVILLMSVSSMVFAQEQVAQEPTSKLTFDEAVKIALKNNVNLNQQKNNLFSRQVQRNQSVANFLPQVRLQGFAEHSEGQIPNPDGGELQDTKQDFVGANIRADLGIFNGLNRLNTFFQTSQQFKSQTALVNRTKQDVVFNVTNQYLQVLLDQELLRIANENYKTQNTTLEQLREQVNVGARPEADLYVQDAQVRNMELLALRAQVTLQNDKATFAQTLQLDPSIDFELVFPPFNIDLISLEGIAMDSLFAVALKNREDLKQARFQAEANENQHKASINGYYPTIGLYAQYGSQYNSQLKPSPLYGDFRNQFTNVFPNLAVGVNVTVPIFDRMITRNLRVQNKVAYDNAILQRDNLEKTVKIDVQRAYNNYTAAIKAYYASQVQFQAGELALRTQQESFVLGVSSQVTLAQANQTYVLGAASRAQAEVTLMFQKYLLDYSLGTLTFDETP